MKLARAWLSLVWLSFRRLLWSTSTLMVLFPLAGCTLFLLRKPFDAQTSDSSFRDFSHFMILVFASFVVPICSLAYGTASIGGDREDRTLLFVLVRPIPRMLVLLAKYVATLPLVLGLVYGSFLLFCHLAGSAGELAQPLYLWTILSMAVAYLGVFHLFAVSMRHSTIAALIYCFLMEFILGNMPGIVKRVAVNYYGRSLMYTAAASHGLLKPKWFEPISTSAASLALLGIGLGGLLLALVIFERREYRDLT